MLLVLDGLSAKSALILSFDPLSYALNVIVMSTSCFETAPAAETD